ncbi:MAG: hypothetical protein WC881_07545 [Elusimicrobiota bacterium]|jgi:hypothetical protein
MKGNPPSALLDIHDLDAVWAEVKHLLLLISPRLDLSPIETAYDDLLRLFSGHYPGYRACNTRYHDIHHSTDTLVAMVRLMHGAHTEGRHFTQQELRLAPIAAIFHDSGYIQTADDTKGTGAKYTACHVKRSIEFLSSYLLAHGFPQEYIPAVTPILDCTRIDIDISKIDFPSDNSELLGQMLGTGDILSQMADREYLEKLLFLFYEFKEGKIRGFTNEFDLLKKTAGFYAQTKKRLNDGLGGVNRFMRVHFRTRWGLDRDLYAEAIDRHLAYLQQLTDQHHADYREMLNRGRLVQKLRSIEKGQ